MINQNISCHICNKNKAESFIFDYWLCHWCGVNVQQFIKNRSRNILWGAGRINRGQWISIKRVLKEYDIKSLIEFGCGLSTEMFSLESLDIWSLDILDVHIGMMRKAIPNVTFIHYTKGKLPEIDRRFDMAFVDGPQGYRTQELELALKVSDKIVLCHDWQRGQEQVDITGWKQIKGPGRMFERIIG